MLDTRSGLNLFGGGVVASGDRCGSSLDLGILLAFAVVSSVVLWGLI